MKRKIVWGGVVLVIAAVLAYFLWPMPLGEVLPEGEISNIVYIKHILTENGEALQESTDFQLFSQASAVILLLFQRTAKTR